VAPGNSWRFGRFTLGESVLLGYSAAGAVLDVSASEFMKSGEISPKKKVTRMKNLTLIYWKSEKFYLGKLLEQPEIMTQGETFEELIKNIKDAYYLMVFDDVPEDYQVQEIAL